MPRIPQPPPPASPPGGGKGGTKTKTTTTTTTTVAVMTLARPEAEAGAQPLVRPESSEATLLVVSGDDPSGLPAAAPPTPRHEPCHIEIQMTEKHHPDCLRATMPPRKERQPTATVGPDGALVIKDRIDIDFCAAAAEAERAARREAVASSLGGPALRPSPKSMFVNDAQSFHSTAPSPPRAERQEVERAPVLPVLGQDTTHGEFVWQKSEPEVLAAKVEQTTIFKRGGEVSTVVKKEKRQEVRTSPPKEDLRPSAPLEPPPWQLAVDPVAMPVGVSQRVSFASRLEEDLLSGPTYHERNERPKKPKSLLKRRSDTSIGTPSSTSLLPLNQPHTQPHPRDSGLPREQSHHSISGTMYHYPHRTDSSTVVHNPPRTDSSYSGYVTPTLSRTSLVTFATDKPPAMPSTSYSKPQVQAPVPAVSAVPAVPADRPSTSTDIASPRRKFPYYISTGTYYFASGSGSDLTRVAQAAEAEAVAAAAAEAAHPEDSSMEIASLSLNQSEASEGRELGHSRPLMPSGELAPGAPEVKEVLSSTSLAVASQALSAASGVSIKNAAEWLRKQDPCWITEPMVRAALQRRRAEKRAAAAEAGERAARRRREKEAAAAAAEAAEAKSEEEQRLREERRRHMRHMKSEDPCWDHPPTGFAEPSAADLRALLHPLEGKGTEGDKVHGLPSAPSEASAVSPQVSAKRSVTWGQSRTQMVAWVPTMPASSAFAAPAPTPAPAPAPPSPSPPPRDASGRKKSADNRDGEERRRRKSGRSRRPSADSAPPEGKAAAATTTTTVVVHPRSAYPHSQQVVTVAMADPGATTPSAVAVRVHEKLVSPAPNNAAGQERPSLEERPKAANHKTSRRRFRREERARRLESERRSSPPSSGEETTCELPPPPPPPSAPSVYPMCLAGRNPFILTATVTTAGHTTKPVEEVPWEDWSKAPTRVGVRVASAPPASHPHAPLSPPASPPRTQPSYSDRSLIAVRSKPAEIHLARTTESQTSPELPVPATSSASAVEAASQPDAAASKAAVAPSEAKMPRRGLKSRLVALWRFLTCRPRGNRRSGPDHSDRHAARGLPGK